VTGTSQMKSLLTETPTPPEGGVGEAVEWQVASYSDMFLLTTINAELAEPRGENRVLVLRVLRSLR
jgi:hypothetical protein